MLHRPLAVALVASVLAAVVAFAQHHQTPIDIVRSTAQTDPGPKLRINYPDQCTVSLEDTFGAATAGYTIAREWATLKATPACDASVAVGTDTYKLVQFHFHTPSEHSIDGVHAPMEVHFVHMNTNGCSAGLHPLLVVGAMISAGPNAGELGKILAPTPLAPQASLSVNLRALLPPTDSYWRYDGRLTAPNTDCSWSEGDKTKQLITGVFPESVNWYLLESPLHLPAATIRKFKALYPEGNARPLKSLEERPIYHSGTKAGK